MPRIRAIGRASYPALRPGASQARDRLNCFPYCFFCGAGLTNRQVTMNKACAMVIFSLTFLGLALSRCCLAQSSAPATEVRSASAEKVIIDTDIGDDIDDAFAVALALRSPELQILGISTTFGDTEARAKLLDRLLREVGRSDIPVAVGTPTTNVNFTQKRYAEGGHFARASHSRAVDFILDQIRRHPGEITLVAIGPLVNVGALIDKDAQTFRKLRRVVLMGGSVERGYGDLGYVQT